MAGYKHSFRSAAEQLSSAAIKLQRAQENGGVDPTSGFSQQAIVEWLVDFPELGDEKVIQQTQAVLRRYGFNKEADSFFV